MIDMHHAGAVSKQTMRDFDAKYFAPIEPQAPEEIRALRDRESVSQAAFASHLGVSAGLVSKWERGEKKPSGPSLKLLDLVARKGLDAIL
jgi:putative transcriptional regulator